jgi:drug/metabolite transporter (DMT)-like permease
MNIQSERSTGSGRIYALLAAALFGLNTPISKLLLLNMTPLMLSGLLYLGAAIALLLFRAIRGGSAEASIKRHDLGLISGIIGFGAILGPVLMLLGLQRLSSLSTALLLNLEAPFTMLIAVSLMREHLGRRESLAAGAILIGGIFLSLGPSGELSGDLVGILEVMAACLCWGIDNNLTQRISLRDPVAVASIKTSAAGVLVTGLAFCTGGVIPHSSNLLFALLVGAFCYGVSIVLDVFALRKLGAAREAAYFATAPFIGALASVAVLGEVPRLAELIGAALMAAGVVLLITERHRHLHAHDEIEHDHLHYHDKHHDHSHNGPTTEPHSHAHKHQALTHIHPHFPDEHHRHSH